MSRNAGRSVSVDGLVNDWSRFIAAVERGYDNCVYEYENDLSVRDLLEEVITAAPESVRRKIRDVLAPWDRRFDEATLPTSRPLLPSVDQRPPGWWWFRLPRRRTDELAHEWQELCNDVTGTPEAHRPSRIQT